MSGHEHDNATSLVTEETSTLEHGAAAVVGLAFLAFVLSWTTIIQVTTLGTVVASVTVETLFGLVMVAMGVSVVGFGLVSRAGVVETNPDRTAGLVTAVAFGFVGFVAGALVASQTAGLGGTTTFFSVADLLWFAPALLVSLGVAVVSLFPREDIGSTLPAGAFAIIGGALVLGGVLDPSWAWKPANLSATFKATVVVPSITIVASLLCGWAAAKVHGGFGSRGRENGAFLLIGLVAFGMISVLVLLIAYVTAKGFAPATQGFSLFPFEWPFVTNGYTFLPDKPNGVRPAIIGTVWLVIGTVLIAVPLGVGAAVFLTEYAEQGAFTRVVEVTTNGLWSTPSIVFGLFGYAFLVPRLGNSTSLLAGIIVLSFMLLPLVLITSREAIKAVPDEYRDASAALGVSQWETIRSVVLPAAMPGVITGIILGVGRIAGETAPLILVMAGGLRADAPNVIAGFEFMLHPPFVANDALLQSAPALPYQLYAIITAGVSENQAFGWGTAFILLLVVLTFYAVGIASRIYFRRKLSQQ